MIPGKTRSPVRLVAAFIVAVVGLIVVLHAWHEMSQRAAQVAQSERGVMNIARAVTSDAEDTLRLADTILSGRVERLTSDGTSREALRRLNNVLAMRVKGGGTISGLFVYDETGDLIASSRPTIIPGSNNADRAYFARHRADPSDEPYFGPPERSRGTGEWIVTLSRRVSRADGRFAGIVLATMDIKRFTERFSTFDVGRSGIVAFLMKDGTGLAGYPYAEENIGRDFSKGTLFQKNLREGPAGVGRFVSPVDGKVRIAGYVSGATFPVVGYAAVSEAEALAAWQESAIISSVGVLLLGGGIVVLGLRLLSYVRRQDRIEAELSRNEARFRLLAEHSGDVISSIDGNGIRRYVSPAAAHVLGKTPEQLVGRSFMDDLDPRDVPVILAAVGRLRSRRAPVVTVTHRVTRPDDGRIVWLETSVRPAGSDGTTEGVVATSRDVTSRKALEDELASLARTDALTGLPNRRAFDERLDLEWRRSRRDGTPLAMAMFDLDRFKAYNDRLGHQAGDECLARVAGAFRNGARRPGDFVARYGGEEIAVLLAGCSPDEARATAQNMLAAVTGLLIPHPSNVPHVTVTVSAGLADRESGEYHAASDLVRAADAALYAAKANGRACLVSAGPASLRLAS